ncbi:MAG: hypothetical protein IKP64_12605, partial [Selenomonadaceae bacterium]|nr:hypothetical protein [Selenomonadaceae bacterium]
MDNDISLIEINFSRLRDCFYAGYTLPQFCVDSGIKRPLILSPANFSRQILWEIYVQFAWDKRFQPIFVTLEEKSFEIDEFTLPWFLSPLAVKSINEIDVTGDKIFFLSMNHFDFGAGEIIYLNELIEIFTLRTYFTIPAANFAKLHPDVKIFAINFPRLKSSPLNTDNEKILLRSGDKQIQELLKNFSADNKNHIPTPFDLLGYDNEKSYGLLQTPIAKTNRDGTTTLQGDGNKYLAIRDGKRLTANQPENFTNRIYFLGNCVYFGWGVPFDKTLTRRLQALLNENNLPYRVENESQFFAGHNQDIYYNLHNLPVQAGDVVFVCTHSLNLKDIPFIDVENFFRRPHEFGEVFFEPNHINELGHKALAEGFFALLTQNNFFRDTEQDFPKLPPHCPRYGIPPKFDSDNAKNFFNAELETYKQKLRARKIPVGAIVMNCNPFTLGHLHLIEYAAAQVVRLYIFVVEEDKSEFPFADRFELVRRGVKKFSNVEVLPSGKFIISQQTFSGYFNKAELQDAQVDSSEDVEIFATEIAPELGITIRFAGEEPT